MVRGGGNLWMGVALTALVAVAPMAATAQGVGADSQISVSIPAQRLSDALRQLAEASHLQLIYDTKITDGKTSQGISGAMTSRAALAQLLSGSGLSFQFSGDRTVTISAATAAGVRAVGVVNVEGVGPNIPYGEMASAVNGVNGSSDVEATEGTGSYTTGAMSIVSKIPQSIRETPQSVSVITSQRIADQGLLSIQDVLDAMPGITTTSSSTNTEFEVYSRGFKVTSYAFDGGAPVSYALGNRPVIDISEFDSVQLIRGADGLFGGYGDPGGFVNLERKKPLDHNQLLYSQDVGSWNNFREEADVTAPLTPDGKLKGRATFAEQDQDYYYKIADGHKSSIYGVLEYDLTPTTIFTLGANYVRERNITNSGGLPRYSDGSPINWPTSTCLCEPYDYDNANRTEIFATFSDKINDNLSTKLNVNYNNEDVNALYYILQSTIKPGATPANTTSANGNATGNLTGFSSKNPVKTFTADYALNGKIKVLGSEQTFVVGANYAYYIMDGQSTTYYNTTAVPDVFQYNPSLYPPPTNISDVEIYNINRQLQYGVYANTKLKPIRDLQLYLGVRYSGYRDYNRYIDISQYGNYPSSTPPLKDQSNSTLDAGIAYDFFKTFTVYAGHESIYQPQFGTTGNLGHSTPPPITGINDEVGLKWEAPNKLLNAALSVFRNEENGFETNSYVTYPPTTTQPVIGNERSSGFDIETTGQLLPELQVSANYTYDTTKTTLSGADKPLSSYAPKDKLKTFATYRPKGSGVWGHLILGGGVDFQSSAFTAAPVCTQYSSFGSYTYCSKSVYVPFITKGYATLALKIGYQINKHIELSLDAKNVTNVKAYVPNEATQTSAYNYYTQPLSFLLSLRFKW